MSSTEYGPWDDGSENSETILNKLTIPHLTGDTIATLDPSLFGAVKCVETGSGFTVDHLYLSQADGTGFIDASVVAPHTHTSTDGGEIIEIFAATKNFAELFLSRTTDLLKANWIQFFSGTGTIEDFTDGTTGERSIRLRPNATSGSSAGLSYPHLQLFFARRSFYAVKVRIETASSLAFHTGINADDVTSLDSNTRKYNAEICTTVNNNWFLRTADGTAKSSSDTGIAMTTNRTFLLIDAFPQASIPEIDLYVDAGTVLQKTSNIPVGSSTDRNNLIKHSIKNSVGSDRPVHIYPNRLRFRLTDLWA